MSRDRVILRICPYWGVDMRTPALLGAARAMEQSQADKALEQSWRDRALAKQVQRNTASAPVSFLRQRQAS